MKSKTLIGVVALAVFGSGPTLACNPGDIQCDGAGYRYVCQCYTTDGCQYYSNGTCSAYRGPRRENDIRAVFWRSHDRVEPNSTAFRPPGDSGQTPR